MDAGVLQLQVFEHQASAPIEILLDPQDEIRPDLICTDGSAVTCATSLIVPTFYNSQLKRSSLQRLVTDLANSKSISELVLVLADGKQENLPELPSGIDVKYVNCPPNQRAAARNFGAREASNEMLLFMDDDMLATDWRAIDSIVGEVVDKDFDAAMFPRRQYARFPLLYDSETLQRTVDLWRESGGNASSKHIYDPVREGAAFKTVAFCFPGCFMAIRKDAFESLGGFPEHFHGWGFEDSDFALRAISVLRVLNLFRRTTPFLHIDHPVSPYKSEEYQENLSRFLLFHSVSDVERLCESVINGEDFQGQTLSAVEKRTDLHAPLTDVLSNCELQLGDESAELQQRILRNYESVLHLQMEDSQPTKPSFGVLHGSRGASATQAKSNDDRSDFDLLFLFPRGNLREFYTDHDDRGRAYEFEYASVGKFEFIAMQPVKYPFYGPPEMAKLARGKLLFGDAAEWEGWRTEQISLALEYGRLYWLLYAIGMHHMARDHHRCGATEFGRALAEIMCFVGDPAWEDETKALEEERWPELQRLVQRALDAEMHGWREDLKYSRRFFAYQVGEVWTALRLVAALDA